jgi:hypothetical protein
MFSIFSFLKSFNLSKRIPYNLGIATDSNGKLKNIAKKYKNKVP